MKRIEAVIQPFKLDEVRDGLAKLGIQGMTAFEAKGCGRQIGHTEIYRGNEYSYNFIPKIYFFVVVKDDQAKAVVEMITEIVNTRKIGAGKIFVSDVEEVVRIRTKEIGPDAL